MKWWATTWTRCACTEWNNIQIPHFWLKVSFANNNSNLMRTHWRICGMKFHWTRIIQNVLSCSLKSSVSVPKLNCFAFCMNRNRFDGYHIPGCIVWWFGLWEPGFCVPNGIPPALLPPPTPGPCAAFIIFLYFDRRFWNQIFTCKKNRGNWLEIIESNRILKGKDWIKFKAHYRWTIDNGKNQGKPLKKIPFTHSSPY